VVGTCGSSRSRGLQASPGLKKVQAVRSTLRQPHVPVLLAGRLILPLFLRSGSQRLARSQFFLGRLARRVHYHSISLQGQAWPAGDSHLPATLADPRDDSGKTVRAEKPCPSAAFATAVGWPSPVTGNCNTRQKREPGWHTRRANRVLCIYARRSAPTIDNANQPRSYCCSLCGQ
jgi:hypothetical protein